MQTGVAMFATHDAIDPGTLARLVEQRGHDALYFPEHTHIPASRESPWAGRPVLPRNTYDLFVAMTAAAVAATRLRIGSGVCL